MMTRRALGLAACVWLLAGCGGGDPGGRALQPATTRPAKLAAVTAAAPSRIFAIDEAVSVPTVRAATGRVDLWVPLPSSDSQQSVDSIRFDASLPHELITDREYGNAVLHVWSQSPADRFKVKVHYRVDRRDERAFAGGPEANVSRLPAPGARLLQPDRLGVIDEPVRALAARITNGKPDTLSKARAIYDYVIAHMAYGKAAPGWGNGDTRRACEVCMGNCTDFHALFISLARASAIPARFGIGYQVPRDKHAGRLKCYHCWAEFWLPGTGWVPVDASEAWKDPEQRDFYFGNLDDDRFRVSLGRDVRLPGMDGQPLNYLLAPVAEADGHRIEVRNVVTFAEQP
jgi:transglutaminase-like putative cysteine protease